MKKTMILTVMIIALIMLSACVKTEREQVIVLSFYGENEMIRLDNGVIILRDRLESFEGGNFEVLHPEMFTDITYYTTTFYTTIDGEKSIIISDGTGTNTGDVTEVGGGLGSASGEIVLIDCNIDTVSELKDNLWFELKTADKNGAENVYQLRLDFTEITQVDLD